MDKLIILLILISSNGNVVFSHITWSDEIDGFTHLQAIKIASVNGATPLGLDQSIGTIETGKAADLLVVDGDPSTNIGDIRKVLYVLKKVIRYNSKRLFESMKGKVGTH